MNVRIADATEFSTCLDLRFKVFVDEQNVPIDLERDALDKVALHLLGEIDGHAMGTARVVFQKDTAKIGRVCVLPDARGTGLGRALIKAALSEARKSKGITRAALGAQLDALTFYEKLGFSAYGPVFDDAGIDHRMMELRF